MKVTRKMLLYIIGALGLIIIVYSLIRQFTGHGLGEKTEERLMNIIIVIALGLFFYNRQLARDEQRAKETKERAEQSRLED